MRNKRFRCGLLSLKEDGKVKKLDLANGGGSRVCDWSNKFMTLHGVYRHILNIFKLEDTERETSLYDFKMEPLNFNQYRTFFDYIKRNGLKCTSTVIYVCIHEASNGNVTSRNLTTSEPNVSRVTRSMANPESSVQTTMSSSTTRIGSRNVVTDERHVDQQHSENSSYEHSLINLIMRNLQDLISQHSFNAVLMKLFETMSIIHGYSSLTIDSLKRRMQRSEAEFQLITPTDITLHSNCLENFYRICESAMELFERTRNEFSQIQLYSLVRGSFIHFYSNIKLLRDEWLKRIKQHEKAIELSSLSSSSSSSIQSVELKPSTSSHLNTQFVTPYALSIKAEPFCDDNVDRFQKLLDCANDLLNTMNDPSLSTFRDMIQSLIVDVETMQSIINMCDQKSITNAVQAMHSIKFRYTKTFSSDVFKSSEFKMTRTVKQAYQKTLTAICDLLAYLKSHTIVALGNRTRNSSISITVEEQVDSKEALEPIKRRLEGSHADTHDQFEISSIKSEIVMEDIENTNKRRK